MSASGHQDPSWNDFDQVRHSIKNYTVDRLKQIITGLSEGCGAMIAKSGKKQDLIDRITQTLDTYRTGQHTERWNRARGVIYQVQRTGTYHSGTANGLPSGLAAQGIASSATSLPNGYHQSPGGAGPSGISRYDPMTVHRRTAPSSATSTPVKHGTGAGIKFKSSPFFSIDQAVSNVVECPESSGAMDRKQQTLVFALTQEHLNKLSQSNPKYQLRLFCTSSSFYVASPGGFRSNALPCPIEFPATCEVRVNNVQLSANLKGVKKKPGTAPPADLGRSVRSVVGAQNRVEMVYVNSQQPIKYYLAVLLVEVTNVEQLVEKLRKGKYRSSDEIKSGMLKSAAEDDEIVAGNQTMSLKCPLSYARIKTPCKSDKCVHSQCFDGTSWYSVMEQTTTWLCPVCEKVLNWEDLIVDGFFDAILRQTPESVEEVVVEPNGEWYTADKKYASAGWKAAHASNSPAQRTLEPAISANGSAVSHTPAESISNGDFSKNNPAGNASEVFVLDSDDEDEGRVKRELSPTFGSSHINGNGKRASTSMSTAEGVTKPKRQSAVIDLTLDSDSDEPPAPQKLEKRKADDSLLGQGDSSSKRPRGDIVPLTTRRSANGYNNGATSSSSSSHPYYSSIPPPLPLSPSVRSSNHLSVGTPNSTTHRTSVPAPLHASSRYGAGYNSYSPPHLPGRPGSYDPTRPNDPRSHQYAPPYSSNGYLPRVNGSGPSAWP
ncbi:hypothetical protein BD410DRAFT_862701 [Rickenella mellea]|uniref:PINIT domain-containing protein n=1 Tax=Rickenella mellea TaxID=50990 RepID=A0A4Y7QML0_9AGAM|nr:hypothetical protein BD410DRAFT_862701 [Rickenella mellea]